MATRELDEESLIFERLREQWETFEGIVSGELPPSKMPRWETHEMARPPGKTELDDEIPFNSLPGLILTGSKMAKTFLKLSRAAIRKVPKGQSITEHGITLERLANGDGLYTVNIMVDRQRIHRTIGRESEGVTRSMAEDFIAKARHDARKAALTCPSGRKVALTFAEAAPRYIERLRQEGGNNINRKQHQLEQSLTPFFGQKPLSQIAAFDIERYKKQRSEEKSEAERIRAGRRAPQGECQYYQPRTCHPLPPSEQGARLGLDRSRPYPCA